MTTEMTARSWNVLEDNVPTLRKLIDRLNRKARKHGLNGLSLSVDTDLRETIKDGADIYVTVPVYVRGDAPRLRGWEFVATIAHAGEAGNILRTVPTFDGILPEEFRTSDPGRCDHCKAYRRRSDTFVVTDGTLFRQVGRQCLADFIGSDRVESVMAMAEVWSLLSDGMTAAQDFDGRHGERLYSLGEIVSFAAQVVLTEGWVSRSKAESLQREATADLALAALAKAREGDTKAYPTEAAILLADRALEWAPSWIERELKREQSSDYVWNMSVVLKGDYITHRSVGLAVSVLGAYQREQEQEVKREQARATSTSVHVGTVGKRERFENLTVRAARYIDGNYGTTTLLTFTDPSGNVIKWFASGYSDLKQGDVVTLEASVKAHGEYNGIADTTITRAKVK